MEILIFIGGACCGFLLAAMQVPAFAETPVPENGMEAVLEAQEAQNTAQSVLNNIDKRAPIDSPALTGIPTAPTPDIGNNSNQIATAGFVMRAIANIPRAEGESV